MRTIATTFTLVIAGAALTGCSGSSSTDAAGTDTADACDAGTFTAAVEQLLASQGGETKLISLDGFECDGDWAVTFRVMTHNSGDARDLGDRAGGEVGFHHHRHDPGLATPAH